jgi:hypothetical protein
MEQKELKLTIQLTEKDYLKFQWAHTGLMRSRKWLLYGLSMLVLYSFILIPALILNDFSALSLSLFLPLLILLGLFIFPYGFFMYRSRSAFKSDSFINQPYEVIINEEGMIVNAYRSNLNPLWKDIYRYNVTKEAIYIYIAELKAILVPSRFLNEADRVALMEILKTKVNTENYTKQKKKNTSIRIIYYVVVVGVVFFIVFKDCGSEKREEKAYQLQKKNNFAAAKKVYTELIESDPENADYYLERANCEISLIESGFAVMDCEKALKLDPENGKAYYYYAFALYNNRQYDAACKAIHTSIKLGYTNSVQKLCDITDSQMDSLYSRQD